MKISTYAVLTMSLFPFALTAADNTYYLWAGATKAGEEINLLKSENWSISNTEYVAPPEGTEMNSPTANWVIDHDAYLPISGRNDCLLYRLDNPVLDIASLKILNQNPTETSYYASDGLKTGGANTIKILSATANASWNIGEFTYTGTEGGYTRGATLASASKWHMVDVTIGTVNIGYGENTTKVQFGDNTAGIAYATVETADNKVGDPIEIWDASGLKSLTVTGNFNIHGGSTVNMNVWNDDEMASHSEYIPDVLINGIVNMTKSEGGSAPTWNLLYRETYVNWKASMPYVPATDTYIKIGGLQGEGRVSNESKTLEASTVKLIFTNAVDCEFKGDFTENRTDTIKTVMSVKMAGVDGKMQIIDADAKFTGTVEVESGALIMRSSTALGKLTMSGGEFGAINGNVIVSEAAWNNGDFIFYSGDALNGGLPDKIIIEGTFSKEGDGQIGIDFYGFDGSVFAADGTKLELISAGALDGFSDDANDDFYVKNLLNASADFEWDGNTLMVSFVSVPEPEFMAFAIGIAAMVSMLYKRRR